MGELKMPSKGKGASMLQELNAEHATPFAEQEKPSNEETSVTTLQETPVSTIVSTNETASVPSILATKKREKKTTVAETTFDLGDRHPLSDEALRLERLSHALQMGEEDDVSVVTVRVSTRLNEYLDRYVQRVNQITPKRKYRKQDAILEAFAAFFADHVMPPAPTDDGL